MQITMNTLTLLIQILVGLGFIARGITRFITLRQGRGPAAVSRIGRVLRWTVGGLEVFGGLAMWASIAQPFMVFFVALVLLLIGAGSAVLHLARRSTRGLATTGLLIIGAMAAGFLQPLGLRVLALPGAEVLPMDTVESSRVVKTYGEGQWLESVKLGPDGTIYLTSNQGENYATGDKSQVKAHVIARAPDGTERVFFALPQGTTAGVMAFDHHGRMFMTSQGASLGVWRIDTDGHGERFTSLPQGAWPNGITIGPDQHLYVADSALGVIWRINAETGEVRQAMTDNRLRARPWIALAPGANGIHFFGRELYVTVSDAGKVFKTTLDRDNSLGPLSVFAEGIPGDDFAIDEQGSLYVTTHPFNTVVRITQSGERTVVATTAQGVTGATDAAFGVLPGDRDTLYVATDGGAFSGDTKARGTLIALKLRTAVATGRSR